MMVRDRFQSNMLALVLGLGLALALSGCAPASGPSIVAASGHNGGASWTPAAEPAPFTRSASHRMLTAGFAAVSSRYIEPLDMAAFLIAGLRGLDRIDPALDAGAVGDAVAVTRQGRRIASFPRPDDRGAADWAGVGVDAIQALRAVSPDLAVADAEAVYDAFFDAALANLDSFSRYAGAEEARLNRGTRNGFGGIGILFEIEDDTFVMVREVVPGGPAGRAGLRAGDRIVAVDGVAFSKPTIRIVRERLRGPVGSKVDLTLSRESVATVAVERGLIVMPTVDLTMENGIAIIRVSSFNQATAEAVADAVQTARAQGQPGGIILDMRGNPGGLLDQSVTVADLFLDDGTIVTTRGRHPEARQFYSASQGDIAEGLPIVILMDGESASAAEIVAAALQDDARAAVVGTTSYGKGTVQTVVQLPNGGEITLTWSRFHSPSGYVLHGLGVPPVACTSGRAARTEPAVVDSVLADLRGHAAPIARRMALWRDTGFQDTARRRSLRALCPAEHHEPGGLDEVIARRLIQEPALYARAIGLIRSTAEAAR